jgi:hypothetical protein
MHLSSPPYVLHGLIISVFSIWSPEWYLVRSTKHKAPCYVVFSTPKTVSDIVIFISVYLNYILPSLNQARYQTYIPKCPSDVLIRILPMPMQLTELPQIAALIALFPPRFEVCQILAV